MDYDNNLMDPEEETEKDLDPDMMDDSFDPLDDIPLTEEDDTNEY